MIAKGEMKPPAIVINTKGAPRGMTKEEIRDGLDQSKEKEAPAILDWEYGEK